ncbi:16S rRNA (guanine(527)-N(7))-methyltransferase RsmG [Loktanella sp. D2R18]|uniref:16S rRNA (guanine(527)-N(7))-methyltransferase RsmG n=1 Tax=Rhodobacterales TaxID=204455 RepID=UPI000DEBF32E|nr:MULTISPECIES: 16S rRNA (guanine(527)-N(7))-methyltransferase RsmG [Rhodobacterales]MDO6590457.1 16S rRNA (guanine(527)-N(7))-methyltransferase RsmG [Yoonia sp. 1_MG-2023]RBW41179.1 16S rRNA (guanine(527)-N(7))-methyltransferase RsmG [Loktanella sp. D2R18]
MGHDVGGVNVSRETLDDLHRFSELVQKWTTKINLISPSTVSSLWERHIVDSAQIYASAPKIFNKWVDIGSGGGFPGIVVAIIGKVAQPNAMFILIESDQRKATFLRSAIRELDLPAKVLAERIENAAPQNADIVSARALSTLSTLLPFVERHLKPDGQAILHKGKRAREEVADAANNWRFALEDSPSLTDPDAQILIVKGISRVSE